MDDLAAAVSAVLNDPESMKQLQGLASSLGLGQAAPVAQPPPDLSALSNILGGLLEQNRSAAQPADPAPAQPGLSTLAEMLNGALSQNQAQTKTAPDLSGLAGILGNALGGNMQPQPQNQSSGFDVSALTNMLGGSGSQDGQQNSPLGIDMNMILKLQQAMSSMQANRQNIDFLVALKPRLNAERSKKVDDAIKVMQLIQFLPLLKDSGIFKGLDGILEGITGSGGLSGILGGGRGSPGGGLGGILSGLLGRL